MGAGDEVLQEKVGTAQMRASFPPLRGAVLSPEGRVLSGTLQSQPILEKLGNVWRGRKVLPNTAPYAES